MAGKGAPRGNQNARKDESERGINVSLYLGSRELDTLRLSLQYEQKEPTTANVRAKVRKLAQDAISTEVRRTFARFAREHGE